MHGEGGETDKETRRRLLAVSMWGCDLMCLVCVFVSCVYVHVAEITQTAEGHQRPNVGCRQTETTCSGVQQADEGIDAGQS